MSVKKEKIKFFPFKILNKIFPKSEKIWLFGSWFGDKYSDSPRYLYEYINLNENDIIAIWITKNENVYNLLKKNNKKVYMNDSFLGIYYTLRASICFVTQSHVDINKYLKTPRIFNLWHGNPLKKIGNDANKNKKKFIKNYYLSASSEIEKRNLFTAFNCYEENIFITGLPRNSVFKKSNNILKRIIYMPTHREDSKLNVIDILKENIETLNNFLAKNNLELYLKLHFYDLSKFEMIDFDYSNIKKYTFDEDIYQSINKFDMLITDYSSIYLDYLLSEKPIIFFPYDYNNYVSKDREFYYDYNKVTPGPKCLNWEDIIVEIEKFKNNKKYYKEEIMTIKNKFHKYQDKEYSKRVITEVRRKLNNE